MALAARLQVDQFIRDVSLPLFSIHCHVRTRFSPAIIQGDQIGMNAPSWANRRNSARKP